METPEYLTFEVTDEDILNGKPCQPARCAVALAVNRQYPEMGWGVGVRTLWSAVASVDYRLSKRLVDYVKSIDSLKKPGPARFRIKKIGPSKTYPEKVGPS